MVDRTTADERITREELASYFHHLAEAFESDEETVRVEVGNKSVTLRPPEALHLSVAVVERSPLLRGNREEVTIDLSWHPE